MTLSETSRRTQPRRSVVAVATLGVLWAACPSTHAQAQANGPAEAPEFELPVWDLSRNTIQPTQRYALSSQRGRWIYLDFWASWCGPCRQSFPWMNGLTTRLASRQLDVVAVGLDTRAEPMARFIGQTQPRFTVLWDAAQRIAPLYALKAMPSSFLIDPKGRIVWTHRGFESSEAETIERTLQQRMNAV